MAFWQLTVGSSPETSDGLTNFLWEQGALGVVEEESSAQPARLRAFFPETTSSTGLLGAVVAYRASLRALGLEVAGGEPEIAPLLDAAWASAWQQSFPSRQVGERLVVAPPWEERSVPDHRIPLVIEPGRAFGTGHHGSTEGCLVLLERALAAIPATRALDIGTGSGILAIAAVKLGAGQVLAIDIDPDAVAAARGNAERNGCAGRIEVALTEPAALAVAPFPVVVANLLTHSHLALRRTYAGLVAGAGILVLGGILAAEAELVRDALVAEGFALRDQLTLDGWSSLLLGRAVPPRPRP